MGQRPRIDFGAIKRALTIVHVAKMLNLDLKPDKDGYRCPCSSGRGGPRAIKITPSYVNKDGTLGSFFCHGCKQSGDLINLYVHIKGGELYDAAAALAQRFRIDTPCLDHSPSLNPPQPGAEALQQLNPDHPFTELLGIGAVAATALGCGYTGQGSMGERYLIPLWLPTGKLCGYMGIATKEDQSPLLLFPNDLEEQCRNSPEPVEEPPPAPQQSLLGQMRKLLRVG